MLMERIERIEDKLDALLAETKAKNDRKYNQRDFLAALKISRYKLMQLWDEGYLQAFNPHLKKKNLDAADLAAVEVALEQRKFAKRIV